jgi:hypothetical protein
VNEEEFPVIWDTLNNMVGLMKTEYKQEDLAYEELQINKEVIHNSSH